MLTYDEILEQALQLSAEEQQELLNALQLALEAHALPLGSFKRLAAFGRLMPKTGEPDDVAQHADEFLHELLSNEANP